MRRIGVLARWRSVPGQDVEVASIALPVTKNDARSISSIVNSSIHPTFLINSMNTGYFDAGVLTTQAAAYEHVGYDTDVFLGYHVINDGERLIYELPDGRIWEPTNSHIDASYNGRNAIFELFRIAWVGVSNNVSISTVFVEC